MYQTYRSAYYTLSPHSNSPFPQHLINFPKCLNLQQITSKIKHFLALFWILGNTMCSVVETVAQVCSTFTFKIRRYSSVDHST